MNNELNFPANFERLVLGCIDARDREHWRIVQHFPRSTRYESFTEFCTARTSIFQQIFVKTFGVSKFRNAKKFIFFKFRRGFR